VAPASLRRRPLHAARAGVLSLLGEGRSDEEIADRLDLSPPSVRYHVSRIVSKFGVTSREEAARRGVQAEPLQSNLETFARPLWTRRPRLTPFRGLVLTIVAFVIGFYAWSILFYDSSDSSVLDPVAPGPSAVGVTTRSVTRTLANGNVRTVTYFVWYPSAEPRRDRISSTLPANSPLPANTDALADTEARHPLLVFSHGEGGMPQDSSFLHTHLASHGFVVVAPIHDCDRRAAGVPPPLQVGATCYSNAETLGWPEISALRLDDVTSVLDDLLSLSAGDDPRLRNLVDADRVGVGGFSHGGHTAILAMEADQRFQAGLFLAPSIWSVPGPLPDPAKVAKPTMFMQGEWDHNVTLATTWSLYESIPPQAPDRWFVDIHRAGHFFTNQCVPWPGWVSCMLANQTAVRSERNREALGNTFLKYQRGSKRDLRDHYRTGLRRTW
jgi:DNA-binding CsgD family transcriptional regulator/dienelactone hydrolase